MFITATQEFSVRYRLDLEPAEVALGRDLVRKVLPRWHLAEHVEVAELIVDELATNAQRHSSCPIEIYLSYDGHCLRIEVWDSSTSMPSRKHPTADDEIGRGLWIVDALAQEYGGTRGTMPEGARPGKTVYVILPIRPGLLNGARRKSG